MGMHLFASAKNYSVSTTGTIAVSIKHNMSVLMSSPMDLTTGQWLWHLRLTSRANISQHTAVVCDPSFFFSFLL